MIARRKREGLPVAALVIVLMAVLYGADRFLEGLERREVDAQARHLYEKGGRMMSLRRAQEAAGLFESAHVLERSNRNYPIALASAQIAAGHPEQARATLGDLLERQPNDAQANLMMARAMAPDQRFDEADAYYHRAIYGAWMENARENRLNARLELAEMLASRGRREELLSEVLFLRESAGKDLKLASRVGALFLQAGSAGRAAEVYRSLLRQDSRDASAYAGLGGAELILGNYRSAENAFQESAALDPRQASVRARVELARVLEALDPTPRRLSSAEKYRRSSEILRLTEEAIAGCLAGKDPDSSMQPLFSTVERIMLEKPHPPFTNELSEERLDAAEKLWDARSRICANPPSGNDAIALLMKKLIPPGQSAASSTVAR